MKITKKEDNDNIVFTVEIGNVWHKPTDKISYTRPQIEAILRDQEHLQEYTFLINQSTKQLSNWAGTNIGQYIFEKSAPKKKPAAVGVKSKQKPIYGKNRKNKN